MTDGKDQMAGLAEALTADLEPVRVRSGVRQAGLLALLCGLQLAGFAVLMRERPFAEALALDPGAGAAKVGALGLGALLMTAFALQSLVPGRSVRRAGVWAAGGVLLGAALIGLDWAAVQPGMAGKPVMDGQAGSLFAPRDGVRCLVSSLTLALPLGLALTLMARAGAPPRPVLTGTLIGAAAGLWGGFVYAAQCPYVTAPYVLAWYGAAVVVGTAIGRWALAPRLRW